MTSPSPSARSDNRHGPRTPLASAKSQTHSTPLLSTLISHPLVPHPFSRNTILKPSPRHQLAVAAVSCAHAPFGGRYSSRLIALNINFLSVCTLSQCCCACRGFFLPVFPFRDEFGIFRPNESSDWIPPRDRAEATVLTFLFFFLFRPLFLEPL